MGQESGAKKSSFAATRRSAGAERVRRVRSTVAIAECTMTASPFSALLVRTTFATVNAMQREPSNRGLMWLVVAALAAWGLLLGLGAFLGLDPGTPDYDLRRMGVALAAVGGFLGVWMAAWWARRRR
jgi:hypothetical protein